MYKTSKSQLTQTAEKRLSKSEKTWRKIVWPEIRHLFPTERIDLESMRARLTEAVKINDKKEIHATLAMAHRLVEAFDRSAGIDSVLIKPDEGKLIAVSRRVQWVNEPYDTITIRCKLANSIRDTDLQRLNDEYALTATVHIQAYVSHDERLLQAYLVSSRQLKVALSKDSGIFRTRINRQDGNEFLYAPIADLEEAGVEVYSLAK